MAEQGTNLYGVTIEEACEVLRKEAKELYKSTAALVEHPDFQQTDENLSPGNIPPTCNANVKANLTLAFRHLEDARMRYGKAMQAIQGGESIFDAQEEEKQG